ncbi:hypothetical protein DAEQUDRAFT_724328 [Daedalea quercina L-15889]|uniref:Uncharacterized protein n=1 Tax=Daedalea quercina L-15889 TaxID=1314783 RepID=A0A165S001_9APHY|nr:hypothetical protein DAEQUDRAFT_724328 [Daedalea quercina L-15889]
MPDRLRPTVNHYLRTLQHRIRLLNEPGAILSWTYTAGDRLDVLKSGLLEGISSRLFILFVSVQSMDRGSFARTSWTGGQEPHCHSTRSTSHIMDAEFSPNDIPPSTHSAPLYGRDSY